MILSLYDKTLNLTIAKISTYTVYRTCKASVLLVLTKGTLYLVTLYKEYVNLKLNSYTEFEQLVDHAALLTLFGLCRYSEYCINGDCFPVVVFIAHLQQQIFLPKHLYVFVQE